MYIVEQYDQALAHILKNGVRKENRTGVATRAIFGLQTRYNISERFPIITKRKVWPKAIFAELLWFLSGSTNNKDLQALGSNIWTPWVDPAFEEKHGYAAGSLGPVYGFQLRHFGGYYGNGIGGVSGSPRAFIEVGETTPWNESNPERFNGYGAGGFDQLAYMVDTLKNDPNSRRNLFSLWSLKDLDKMRLPPCHYTFQVFVHDGNLSGKLSQRSCDLPIGSPANIQFYSALIYMLAQQTGLKPFEFIYDAGDAHIYEDQIEAVEEYLTREPVDSPTLNLNKAPDIYSYKMEDFVLENYQPLPPIKIPVAV